MVKDISIVGSGLVGVVLAISLKKKGYRVTVYDRSEDIRNIDFRGRSINLALSDRGWRILTELGIDEEVRELGIPMSARAIHTESGEVKYQQYSIKGDSIWAISRGGLNKDLISIAEREGVVFRFDTPIWDIDLKEGILYTAEHERNQWEAIKTDLIFGADGAYSRVRGKMQKQSRFEYQQSYLHLGYKELRIEAEANGEHKLPKNSFHIWPRKDFMFIALANVDGSFTCTLFMPYEAEISFKTVVSDDEINKFFTTYFKNVEDLIPNYLEQYKENPVNSLVTMKCFPWVSEDKVALIGDAAHAVVPFYGQGLNAGLEDVYVLNKIISESKEDDWASIFAKYQEERKPNGDAIAELSFRNFKEMSEDTADDMFLLRKKIESKFAAQYPDLWLPLYDRVTFSTESYVSALAEGDRQARIMDKIMSVDHINEKWDSDQVMEMIKELL
ncbi:MAG: FAD-dependent oxidoreductase [Flavobacterium sp.]